MASCLGEGTTVITNAAREPEIIDLQNFLNKMGAKVKGAGSNKIEVIGVKHLKDVSYNIMPDRIETGTFLCMAAMTNGNLILENINSNHIVPIVNKLEECGCKMDIQANKIEINAPKRLKATRYKNNAISRISNRLAIYICNSINHCKRNVSGCREYI